MKILYVAPFDSTGYGTASLNYLKCIEQAGIEIVPRRLKYNNEPDHEIYKRLSGKSANGCDVLLQHTLPHHFVYDSSYLNVGMFATETTEIHPNWVENINMMDMAVVFNEHSYDACYKSGVKVPVVVWPHTFDISIYSKKYDKLKLHPESENTYKFLYCGEINERKNIVGLLTAFHSEFSSDDGVSLIIKTTPAGFQNSEAVHQYLEQLSGSIKDKLGRFSNKSGYVKEIVAVEHLPHERLMQLYSTCDAFITASTGEAWGIPGFEMAALEKNVIGTQYATPYLLYNELDVFSRLEKVTRGPGWGYCHIPDTVDLARQMRRSTVETFDNCNSLEYFSYKTVGRKIKEELGTIYG